MFDVYGSNSRDIRIVMERNEAGDQDWEGGWVGLDVTVRDYVRVISLLSNIYHDDITSIPSFGHLWHVAQDVWLI